MSETSDTTFSVPELSQCKKDKYARPDAGVLLVDVLAERLEEGYDA